MDPDEPVDWSAVSFEGSRRRQYERFRALSLREKLLRLEQMAEVARALGCPVRSAGSNDRAPPLGRDERVV